MPCDRAGLHAARPAARRKLGLLRQQLVQWTVKPGDVAGRQPAGRDAGRLTAAGGPVSLRDLVDEAAAAVGGKGRGKGRGKGWDGGGVEELEIDGDGLYVLGTLLADGPVDARCAPAALSFPRPFAALSLPFTWPFAALSWTFRCPFAALYLAFRCLISACP